MAYLPDFILFDLRRWTLHAKLICYPSQQRSKLDVVKRIVLDLRSRKS